MRDSVARRAISCVSCVRHGGMAMWCVTWIERLWAYERAQESDEHELLSEGHDSYEEARAPPLTHEVPAGTTCQMPQKECVSTTVLSVTPPHPDRAGW